MRLFSMAFAWLFGLGESPESTQPEMEPSYFTDTASPEDTAGPLDDSGDEEDTNDTGDTEDTSDTGDTAGDTGTVDTALKSAMDLAGENGGFGCATAQPGAAVSILVGVFALGLRRRD